MSLSLIPKSRRNVGARGEGKEKAAIERAAALVIDLEDAICDGENSLLQLLSDIEDGEAEMLSIDEWREILENIYGQANKIHVALTKRIARKPKSER